MVKIYIFKDIDYTIMLPYRLDNYFIMNNYF